MSMSKISAAKALSTRAVPGLPWPPGRPAVRRRRDRHQSQWRYRYRQAADPRGQRGWPRRGEVPETHHRRGLYARGPGPVAPEPMGRHPARAEGRAGVRPRRIRRDRPLLQSGRHRLVRFGVGRAEPGLFLARYNLPYNKIASWLMLTHTDLVRAVAAEGKLAFVSTGMSTFEEIDVAVAWRSCVTRPVRSCCCIRSRPIRPRRPT